MPFQGVDNGNHSTLNSQLNRRAEPTAKLVEVCLDFPPGVEEHSALFCAHGDHAVFVHGDACHLSIELRHCHALQNKYRRSVMYS